MPFTCPHCKGFLSFSYLYYADFQRQPHTEEQQTTRVTQKYLNRDILRRHVISWTRRDAQPAWVHGLHSCYMKNMYTTIMQLVA